MMTIRGNFVGVEDGLIPSLEEMAYGLRQMPRFGGQTVIGWSVLDHLMACMRVVYTMNERRPSRLELYVGLHDAHEAMTSDVPTTFKTPDFKALQAKLDDRIFDSLNVQRLSSWPRMESLVALIDRTLLVAEAQVVCPKSTYDRIVQEVGGPASLQAVDAVKHTLSDPAFENAWERRVTQLIQITNGGRQEVP